MEPTSSTAPDPRRWQALAPRLRRVLHDGARRVDRERALPSIKTSLHVSENTLQWVLIAYTITFGGLLLLGGRGPTCSDGGGCS
jgi:hypothetical protein